MGNKLYKLKREMRKEDVTSILAFRHQSYIRIPKKNKGKTNFDANT